MRYRRNKSPNILGLIILLSLLSFSLDIFGAGLELIFELLGFVLALAFAGLVTVGPIVGVIYAIKKIIESAQKKKNSNTAKGLGKKNKATVDTKELLAKLEKYFKNNSELKIDDETYITFTDPENINLKTIDIYMREEYIGTLQDYLTAYPNSFNNMASLVTAYLNKKAKQQKQTTVANVEETTKPTAKPVELAKESAYFIKKITDLNNNIPHPQITTGLEETTKYLANINQIEKEFPDCKTKTVKLYQYYLPMMTDILENYKRLQANAVQNAELKQNEDRLLKTIVLINGALETISASLVEDYYTEMNVDMQTLESILKKDGLVDDFKQEG